MKTIYIGFSKPKRWKPFAQLIMFAYGISYDHVYVRFYSEAYDRNIIYQASKSIVNFMGNDVFKSENIIINEFEINISDESDLKLMQFMIDNSGKPYSLKEIVGLAYVKINRFFNRKIENPFKTSTESYVCSTIASYILQNYTDIKNLIDYEDMSPEDVYNLLSKEK